MRHTQYMTHTHYLRDLFSFRHGQSFSSPKPLRILHAVLPAARTTHESLLKSFPTSCPSALHCSIMTNLPARQNPQLYESAVVCRVARTDV